MYELTSNVFSTKKTMLNLHEARKMITFIFVCVYQVVESMLKTEENQLSLCLPPRLGAAPLSRG